MLDRTSPIPLHVQMENILREKLDSGEWSPGQIIPSENELSALCGISRMTVRNVITKLVHEDLLERIPGKGTFVKPQKISANPLSYAGIREQLEKKGYEVSTKLISIEKETVSSNIAAHFSIPADTPFFVIKRLRYSQPKLRLDACQNNRNPRICRCNQRRGAPSVCTGWTSASLVGGHHSDTRRPGL